MHGLSLYTGDEVNVHKKRGRSVRAESSPRQSDPDAVLGRPRDERIDTEVVSVVLDTLKNEGYGAVTIEGIARQIGRARTSLYRRWPSKPNLVAYAVVSEMGDKPAADTGGLRGDLEVAVETLRKAFAGPLGHALAGLVADMAQDPALAASIRRQVIFARRKSMRDALGRARMRGEVRPGLDVELVLDMLTGPFYYRTLFGHAPVTREMPRLVVEYVLQLTAASAART
jgi:AcrR family transcriptional regulator